MQRGEIYIVDLGPGLGREPGGLCPVVVMSADVYNVNPNIVIVVLGIDAATMPASVGAVVPASESGAATDLLFFWNQIRTLDPSRFVTAPVGLLPADKLALLVTRLKSYLDIP